MYRLFCDSNSELWYTKVQELGINVIRMPYVLDGEEHFYDMGEKHDFKAFFDRMRAGATPKTSALNEYAYTEYFEPILARGEDIYYIAFSEKMSGTFQAMKRVIAQLKEKYPDREIRVKDSKSISLGCGFAVYYGALQYVNGATMDELDTYLDDLIAHTATYFVVDDLTYLYRGGRLSGARMVLGNLLGIKPILCFDKEGKIVNTAKVKGMRKALSELLSYARKRGEDLEKYKLFVMHADCEAEANAFAEKLREAFGAIDVVVQPVGPVIGSHCGPGTLGLIFHAATAE